MIQSFRHKGLRKLFEDGNASGVPPDLADKIDLLLEAIDNAESLADLDAPGLKLHPLKGNKKNEPVRYAITVTGNYRITFEFEESEGHAYKVDYEDYH